MKMGKSRSNVLFLKSLEKRLARRHVPQALAEAEGLLVHFGDVDRLSFFTGDRALTKRARKKVEGALRARSKGVPFAHLLGETEFYGRHFQVTEDVLIPRPETELLVEEALKVLESVASPKVLDVGTGSGCIAVSLAMERPDCKVTALDSSAKALRATRHNIRSYHLGRRIRLLKSDLFGGLSGKERHFWDVIVSNPPYVPAEDFPTLSKEVLSEPRLALDGGPKGLSVIRRILSEAPLFLKPGGWLLMEIGKGQSNVLREEIEEREVFLGVRFVKDYAGIERVLAVRRQEKSL